MKKIILTLMICLTFCACCLGFIACSDEHTHTEVIDQAVSATCTTAGKTEGKHCKECNEVLVKQEEVPALGHSLGELISEVPATDTTNGTKAHYHCARCNKDFATDKTTELADLSIPAGTHSFGTLIKEVPATCDGAGTKAHYLCAHCNKYFAEDKTTELTAEDLVIAKLQHSFKERETKPATCTSKGEKVTYCENCDYEVISEISLAEHKWDRDRTCTQSHKCSVCEAEEAAFGHNHEEVSRTPKSCTEDESIVYECSRCHDTYTEVGELHTGHTPTGTPVEKSRNRIGNTCEYELTYENTCSVCEGTYETTDTITQHTDAVRITSEATCVAKGQKEHYCSVCNENISTEEIAINSEAHAWDNGENNDGVITYTCQNEGCGKTKTAISYKEQTDATIGKDKLSGNEVELKEASIKLDEATLAGISATNINISATTLDNTAKEQATANMPKEKKDQLGDNPIYDFSMLADNEPVSNFNGSVKVRVPYTLSTGEDPDSITIWWINDDGEVEEIENAKYVNGFVEFETTHFSCYTVKRLTIEEQCLKYGHKNVATVINPSCTSVGYTINTCSRCGFVERTNTTPALGHDMQKVEASSIAPTCETAGLNVYKCENCDHTYNQQVPALGHKWVATQDKKDATCTESGYIVYKCDYDGTHTYKKMLAPKQHSYEKTVIAPTCTETGYTINECRFCGNKFNSDEKPATGHSLIETVLVDATCETAGSKVITCKNCDYEKQEVISALGHAWDIEAPTCTREQVCTRCDKVNAKIDHNYVSNVCTECGDKRDCTHNFNDGEVIAPTCLEEGYTLKECSICGYKVKEDITPAIGHKGELQCTVCGESILPDDFFVNAIKSTMGNGFALVLNDVNVVVPQQGNSEAVNLEITFAELKIGFDENGNLYGFGSGKGQETNMKLEILAVIKDNVIYCIGKDIESSNRQHIDARFYCEEINRDIWLDAYRLQNVTSDQYIYAPLQAVLLTGTNGELPVEEILNYIPVVVNWYRTDIKPIIDNVLDINNKDINNSIISVVQKLFSVEKQENGYLFTLDFNKVKELNNDLATKTIKEILFTEEEYDAFISNIESYLNKTVGEVIEEFALKGLSIDEILGALNNLTSKIMGEGATVDALLSSFAQQDVNVMAMIETMKDTKIIAIIADIMASVQEQPTMPVEQDQVEDINANEDAQVPEMTPEMLIEGLKTMLNQYLDVNAYEMIAGMMHAPSADAIKEMVDPIIDMIDAFADISFETSLKGHFKNFDISVDAEVPVSEEDNVSIDLSLSFVNDYNVKADYNTLKYEIESILQNFTATEEDTKMLDRLLKELPQYIRAYNEQDNYYYSIESDFTYTLDFDETTGKLKGMFVDLITKRPLGFKNDEETGSVGFKYQYEKRYIDISKTLIMMAPDCNNWYQLDLTFIVDVLESGYTFKYVLADNTVIKEEKEEGKIDRKTIDIHGVVLYNKATGEIVFENTRHNYEYTGEKEAVGCGVGEKYYVCTDCGHSLVEQYCNGHNKDNLEIEHYRVNPNGSCEEGVIIKVTCLDCGKVLIDEKNNWHSHIDKDVFANELDKDFCQEHVISYSKCLCGEETSCLSVYDVIDIDEKKYDDREDLWSSGNYYYCNECRMLVLFSSRTNESVNDANKPCLQKEVRTYLVYKVPTNEDFNISWDSENDKYYVVLDSTGEELPAECLVKALTVERFYESHNYDVDSITTEQRGTCEIIQTEFVHCNDCGHRDKLTTSMSNHSLLENSTTILKPTCTQNGVMRVEKYCENCSYRYVDEVIISSNGHNFTDTDEDGIYCCEKCKMETNDLKSPFEYEILYNVQDNKDHICIGYLQSYDVENYYRFIAIVNNETGETVEALNYVDINVEYNEYRSENYGNKRLGKYLSIDKNLLATTLSEYDLTKISVVLVVHVPNGYEEQTVVEIALDEFLN